MGGRVVVVVVGFVGQFQFFLFVQLDSSIGYASLKKQGGLGKYIIIVLGLVGEP